MLAHDETTHRVALDRHLLRSPKAVVEFFLKGSSDFCALHVQVSLFVDLVRDLLSVLNGQALSFQVLRRPVNCLRDQSFTLFGVLKRSDLLLSLIRVSNQAIHELC